MNASGSGARGGQVNGSAGRGGRDAKGKGRAGGRGGRGGVRRVADYTPAQEPRVAPEAVAEASRIALEKAERERQEEAAGIDGEEQEIDTCYICAEPIKYYALGTCSHRTCHVCSLRLRALYKKRECTFCKTDLPSVITTLDASTDFEDFPPDAFPYSDARLAISFETSQMMEDTLALLRFNCPQLGCDYLGTGWPDLKKHARAEHGLVFCDLCTKHKKIFTHEHTLYTPESLKQHIKEGDPQPTGGADDDERTGFTGHPTCEFCRITFYDNDQLFAHCRDRHEQCFLCIQNGTGRYQYYVDYPHLETHFEAAHYLCLNPQCLKDRFIVFDNQIDLQAHQLSAHNESVPKTARRLETNFSYSSSSRDPRAGGAVSMAPRRDNGPGIGSSASSSSSVLPNNIDTSAPTSTNATASSSSKNRIIPGLQRGGFNTSLSEPGSSSRKNEKKPAQPGTMGDTITGVKQSDPLMAARHASLLSRFSDAVHGNSNKVDAYRAAVRSYRSSESSAKNAIETIYSLLDDQMNTIGGIVTSTADLLDSEEKRRALLDAWGDYSRTSTGSVDAFPSLVPTAPVATQSGNRLAPSTQARAFVPRSAKQTNRAVWDRVEQAAANKNVGAIPGLTRSAPQNKEKFPALPSSSHAVSKIAGARGATPWASHRQQTPAPGSTYFPVASKASLALLPSSTSKTPSASRPASRPTTSSAQEFPDLPQGAPPKSRAYFSRSGDATPNKWATGSISPGADSPGLAEAIQRSLDDVHIDQGQRTSNQPDITQPAGKKKKSKQLLFQYGL